MSHVVYEGPDFSGKTTLAKSIADYRREVLTDADDVMYLTEPSRETPTGAKIRNMLADGSFQNLSIATQLGLFQQQRNETAALLNRHYMSRRYYVSRGSCEVYQDRNYLSSFVYQVMPQFAGIGYRRRAELARDFFGSEPVVNTRPHKIFVLLPTDAELARRVQTSTRTTRDAFDTLPQVLKHAAMYRQALEFTARFDEHVTYIPIHIDDRLGPTHEGQLTREWLAENFSRFV